MSATRIVLLGAPGAGKGTQAQLLGKRLGVAHVSTGDMLRAAVAAKTPVGVRAKAIMDAGKLVPDEMVIGIASERLADADCEKGFILDGFPRTSGQAEALDALLDELGSAIDACLALTVDTNAIVARLLKRAAVEGRADDNETTIRERMRVYDAQTAPLIDYYRDRELLVQVSGVGTIDEVSRRIAEALE